MSLPRYSCELEGTCRSQDQDGSVEHGFVLRSRTSVGDVKNRLNGDCDDALVLLFFCVVCCTYVCDRSSPSGQTL